LAGLALVVLAITIGTVVSMRKSRLADLGKVNPADGTLVTASGEVVKLWGKDGDKIKVQLLLLSSCVSSSTMK
jgi:hypothetical protein